jgi:hypothetical protein
VGDLCPEISVVSASLGGSLDPALVLQETNRRRPAASAEDARQTIVLHFDHATRHTALDSFGFLVSHRMNRAPHPAFSPDLYWFVRIKTAVMGTEFKYEEGLLNGVLGTLDAISRDELESVSEERLPP